MRGAHFFGHFGQTSQVRPKTLGCLTICEATISQSTWWVGELKWKRNIMSNIKKRPLIHFTWHFAQWPYTWNAGIPSVTPSSSSCLPRFCSHKNVNLITTVFTLSPLSAVEGYMRYHREQYGWALHCWFSSSLACTQHMLAYTYKCKKEFYTSM